MANASLPDAPALPEEEEQLFRTRHRFHVSSLCTCRNLLALPSSHAPPPTEASTGDAESEKAPETLELVIDQDPSVESFGTYLWPSASLLADLLWSHGDCLGLKELKILELGCGMALPGLVAAKLGAQVTFTDTDVLPQVLLDAERICQRNLGPSMGSGTSPGWRVQTLNWGEFTPETLELEPHDLLIGADIIYEAQLLEKLLATLSFLRTPLLTVYHDRGEGFHEILLQLREWDLKMLVLPNPTNFQQYPSLLQHTHTTLHVLVIYSPPPSPEEEDGQAEEGKKKDSVPAVYEKLARCIALSEVLFENLTLDSDDGDDDDDDDESGERHP